MKIAKDLLDEAVCVCRILLFSKSVQKYAGPIIMFLYLYLQYQLIYLFHYLMNPSFTISWHENMEIFTYFYLKLGYILSFLCIFLYISVYILGPGKVELDISEKDVPLCKKCSNPKP